MDLAAYYLLKFQPDRRRLRQSIRFAWTKGVILLCSLLVAVAGCSDRPEIPASVCRAEQGILTISNRDFMEEGPVRLDGEWELYRDRLLTPRDLENTDPAAEYVKLPGKWQYSGKNKKGEIQLSNEGCATLRLRIRLKDKGDILGLRIGYITNAYKLWIDDKVVASAGTPGETEKTAVPAGRLPKGIHTFASGRQMTIVLNISSFNSRASGIHNSILLGRAAQINAYHYSELIQDMFLFGSILIIGLYHLILYLLRRIQYHNLLFSSFCFFTVVYLFVNDFSLSSYFFNIPLDYSWGVKLTIISTAFMFFSFLYYFNYYFLSKERKANLVFFGILTGVSSILTIIQPVRLALLTAFWYQLIIIPSGMLFITYKSVLALLKKRENSVFFLSGFSFLFVSGIFDIFYANFIGDDFQAVPWGLLCFIILQAFMLARSYNQAFSKSERLSLDLQQTNRKLLSLDRIKDEFLANTSHELRSPLHGILGIADSLIDGAAGPLPEQALAHLRLITSSGKRLFHLVNDIMDFSRLKHNQLSLQLQPVDIHALTALTLELLAPIAGNKNLKLINGVEPGVPLVCADENRVQQILVNLVGNAIKFTRAGKVNICAREKGAYLIISVKDTGIGIAPGEQEKIFEHFYQVDGSTGRQYEGTGIGLAITRKLVELQGGTVRVESEPGRGSCFSFSLPLLKRTELEKSRQEPGQLLPASVPAAAENRITTPPVVSAILPSGYREHQPKKILVVDDDPVNLQVLSDYLALHNFTPLLANDGREALQFLEQEHDIQLVLLDLMMPGINGFEVCRRIRQDYNLYEKPVLILTAKTQTSDLVVGFDCGANDYLTKPFAREELLSRVGTLYNLKQLTDSNTELQKTNELKTQLMHIIAHDLKNPLTIICNYTDFIEAELGPGQPASQFVEKIKGSSGKMLQLIGEFLKISSLENGEISLFLETVDAREILRAGMENLDVLAREKKQCIKLTSDETRIFPVRVDKLYFQEVIDNLLSNAIKYSPYSREIEIRCEVQDGRVRIEVADQGPGLTAYDKTRVFGKFMKLSARPTGNESSTGLGLSIAKEIVRMHGGDIGVESTQGKGSTFYVLLPLVKDV